jgi:murein DD-endopeptidase MepM/ murein hydrolase activator NlpD
LPPARRVIAPAALVAAIAAIIAFGASSRGLTPAPALAASRDEDRTTPVAGAFVYPVGDELDFTKPHAGEPSGFYISDSYLVRRGKQGQRSHKGIDLSNGRDGSPVRAIASGVVVVSDSKALIRVRTAQSVKVRALVNGKRVTRTGTRYRRSSKWRTGWGNYVVIRHVLPDGQTVHSLYGHLKPSSILVKRGDVVAAGAVIAQVGKTGRASSPHLHLEIRRSLPAGGGKDVDDEVIEESTVEDRTFALLETIEPASFLTQHVRRFDDLNPGDWQTPYALAACRDGILEGDGDKFAPDEAITRRDYYAALAAAFHLGAPAGRASFTALRASLAQTGVLNATSEQERAGDHLDGSEALEVLLRCLDKSTARGSSLASFDRERLCRDFNRAFAGSDAAARAEREARTTARAETAAKRKASEEEFARALRAAKARGAGASVRKRVKRRIVTPVPPVPRLDYGFESLAQSKRNLSRAEACLLLASTLRMGQERTSALEQAATRVATASVE